jgi:hypothetical protein
VPLACSFVFCVMSLYVLLLLFIAMCFLLRFMELKISLWYLQISYVDIPSCNMCWIVCEVSPLFHAFFWPHIIALTVDYFYESAVYSLVLPVLCTSIVVPVSRPAASYYPILLFLCICTLVFIMLYIKTSFEYC